MATRARDSPWWLSEGADGTEHHRSDPCIRPEPGSVNFPFLEDPMNQHHKNGWTSEHLLRPQGTNLYAAQQRERLRQMANEVQALLHEYKSALENIRFEGDKPMEAKVRAFRATRPMAALEKHLRDAVNAAGKIDASYNRFYVELPVKREARAKAKALQKANKAGTQNAQGIQAVNTAANLHGISAGLAENPNGNGDGTPKDQPPATFLDFLKEA
ncbi:hypothetical protein AB0A85_22790 [Kitasatospora aureofaciens]|uniref:hypothetical protein n=1 Tax=Kitasatospora aureofaciens TaxID=1894 RepID=UPI0033C217D0